MRHRPVLRHCGRGNHRRHHPGGLASASRGKLKVVGKPFTQEYYGVGIKKGDTQLATKINNAIVDMIQDGSWENAISDNTKGTNYTPDVRYNPPIPDEGEEA